MIFYHPIYSQLVLPKKHRFPINKYRKLADQIRLLGYEGLLQTPNAASIEQIKLCHESHYVETFIHGNLSEKAEKEMGFPWSKTLVDRTLLSVGASISAAEYALQHKLGVNLAGGYHHAQYDHGAGFCIFNDHAITAKHLINTNQVDKVVILDCDVHQGDGTANILNNNEQIVTCSLHCGKNYPRNKIQSTLDFELKKGCRDEEYLKTLQQALDMIARFYRPDFMIYNAGADIFEKDELGLINVSISGVRQRDQLVIEFCNNHQIPLSIGLGGGYQRDETQLIEVHKQLLFAVFDNC
jgi:acetoin utilization deacetylase AcuC-like enzyme